MKPIPLPKKPVLEKDIENYLRVRVTSLGGMCPKFASPNNRGVCDRIAVMPDGRVWFIELKGPHGRLTKLQNLFLDRLNGLSVKTWRVFWSKEDIDRWLKEEKYG